MAAAAARLARAVVDLQLAREEPGFVVDADVVAERRAAGGDRVLQHVAHRLREPVALAVREAVRGAPRAHLRAPARLARIDVAYADQQPAVHQQRLHARAPATA